MSDPFAPPAAHESRPGDRIAAISDVHGNLPALEAVIADIARRGVDRVVNLGDHASGPLWPAETVRRLMGLAWTHLLGNHDRRVARDDPAALGPSDRFARATLAAPEREWLGRLPAQVETGGLTLFHGSPRHDTTYLLETVERGGVRAATAAEIERRLDGASGAMLCGHSHLPRRTEAPGRWWIVNPGSVGLPAYVDDEPERHVVETGSPHARYAILERTHAGWRVEQIWVPYDHGRAAEQARSNGRPDWEAALRTGLVS